jgi:hypothetical protein
VRGPAPAYLDNGFRAESLASHPFRNERGKSGAPLALLDNPSQRMGQRRR